jgi:hypothetical protein
MMCLRTRRKRDVTTEAKMWSSRSSSNNGEILFKDLAVNSFISSSTKECFLALGNGVVGSFAVWLVVLCGWQCGCD